MAVTKTLGNVADASILADLQGLDVSTPVTGYATQAITNAPQVTWGSEPSAADLNRVASYFQQLNQLRNWS